eukprot:g9333.t1
MVMSAERDVSKSSSVATGGVAGAGGGGVTPAVSKADGMDSIQGKLAGMQLAGGGDVAAAAAAGQQKPYFGFSSSSGGIALGADGSASGGGGSGAANNSDGSGMDASAPNGTGGAGVMYSKNSNSSDGTSAGGGSGAGRASDGNSSVSRRYGVPIASNSRNGAGGGNRGGGGGLQGLAGSFGDDRRRSGGGGGRRAGNGTGGVGRTSSGSSRGGYEATGASPHPGAVAAIEHPQLQVPHMGYGGSNGAMSPGSASMGQQQQHHHQQQPGMYGAGAGTNVNPSGGMGQHGGMQQQQQQQQTAPAPVTLGTHHDPSQQAAMMGQMQQPAGMYYGAAAPYAGHGQAPATPTLSHMTPPPAATGGYPSSPGHSNGYGMQPAQQMGGMDMQQGVGGGYTVGAGGMVHGMGVVPGTPTMQAPYGAYWPSGDVSGYGAMSNGGYDARDYGQSAYTLSPSGGAVTSGYSMGSYGYGYGAHAASPKVNGVGREKLRDRGRSGSVVSMASMVSNAGFGGAGVGVGIGVGDPHRETELSVATDNLSLDEIEGNVFRMSKDQIGCRLLQLKLDQGDPMFVAKICGEAKPYLPEMMKDPFGNYLFQKIVDHVDEAARTDLVKQVAGEMVDAGMNLHGTRSVQKVIEVCRGTPSQVALVVSALKDATVPLCLDTNGNHVVQRLLQHLAPTDNAFVFEMLADACVTVATHRHGCCVLQRAIDAATVEQSRLLVSHVSKHALQLMQDPYGNYVVQYILGICSREEAEILVNVPIGKVAMLSMQKFSSNVIEKCMDRASEEMIVKYVHELADPTAMRPLLQDQYANYVIQKTLQLAPRDAALTLVESIREHLTLMRNSSGGRRMLTKIAKRFPEVSLEEEMVPVAPVRAPPAGGVEV